MSLETADPPFSVSRTSHCPEFGSVLFPVMQVFSQWIGGSGAFFQLSGRVWLDAGPFPVSLEFWGSLTDSVADFGVKGSSVLGMAQTPGRRSMLTEFHHLYSTNSYRHNRYLYSVNEAGGVMRERIFFVSLFQILISINDDFN